MTAADWRVRRLPDGRAVEFLGATWAGDDAGVEAIEGKLAVRVTYVLAGVAGSVVVYLDDAEVLAKLEAS